MDRKSSTEQPLTLMGTQRKRSQARFKCTVFVIACCLALWNFRRISFNTPRSLPGYVKYDGEHISWEPCGDIKGRPVECSTIYVPMNQFAPEANRDAARNFSIPLIRLRGKNATQNLLLNPGGPGGSGVEFVYRFGEKLNTVVGEGFHLVSFDPRGINGSRPVGLCYPDDATRREASNVRSLRVIEDAPEIYAWSRNFGKACLDTMGEAGRYINTPQTAADMNSILDALGQREMIYWGFSYGSLLGQTYATMFPERSNRVIIDGVVNQFHWYESLLVEEMWTDTDHVLEGFFDECIKVGKNCTLTSLADSKEELKDMLLSFSDALLEQPLSVYINSTMYGLFTYSDLWHKGLFGAMYNPKAWYIVAEQLAKLLQGNATDSFLGYGSNRGGPHGSQDEGGYFVNFNDGISGPTYWPHDREGMLDIILPHVNGSLFAPRLNSDHYKKQHWLVPRNHSYVPQRQVKTANPLLILSTTYDPVCPLVSARSANEAFADSRVVEVMGYGHCSIAVESMCVARHVREFLYEGKVPEENVRCEADGPYFLKPEDDGKVIPLKHFEDDEEKRIHIAQIEVAREWDRQTWYM